MSILTLLAALLLSGSSNFTLHTNDVIGGGPVSAPHQSATTAKPPSVNDVSGGGPTSAPKPTKAPPGMTVDDVSSGGPTT